MLTLWSKFVASRPFSVLINKCFDVLACIVSVTSIDHCVRTSFSICLISTITSSFILIACCPSTESKILKKMLSFDWNEFVFSYILYIYIKNIYLTNIQWMECIRWDVLDVVDAYLANLNSRRWVKSIEYLVASIGYSRNWKEKPNAQKR